MIFLDTGQLFAQTLAYQRELADHIGLTNVIVQPPDAAERAALDPANDLWRRDPDACCELRKVRPLVCALAGYDAWITGRKRHQTDERGAMRMADVVGDRRRFNPLAHWTAADIDAYYADHALPRHPLFARGFASIGCHP